MKNILFIASILVILSCEKEQAPKDYAVIHGTISNPIDSLNLRLYDPIKKNTVMVNVDENGNFRDTLRLDEPATFTAVYKNAFGFYIANDMDLKMSLNTENFAESLTFSGKGEAENNFLKFKANEANALYGDDYKAYFSLDQAAFDTKTKDYFDAIEEKLNSVEETVDSTFVSNQKEVLRVFKEQNLAQRNDQVEINKNIGKGMPSPQFNDYVNYAGGTSSLNDYKGSYVYIDVWATWCGPCKYEIPFLDKVEKQYHDKNIKFISLSIDTQKDEPKWREMIKKNNMSGIQLIADKDYESQFIKEYFIMGIPRFILIDPEGNVINYDAPRPSEERLITLFNEYKI